MPYKALERDPRTGRFNWPPVDAETGKRPYRRSQEQIADLAWTLAHAGGVIAHDSGFASAVILDAVNDPDLFASTSNAPYVVLNRAVRDLVDLGLAEVERNGKRTYAVGLTVEPDELPFPDPFPPPEPEPAPEPVPPPPSSNDLPFEVVTDPDLIAELDELHDKVTYLDVDYGDEELDELTNDVMPALDFAAAIAGTPALGGDVAREVADALLNQVLTLVGNGASDDGKDFPYYQREVRKRDERIAVLERDADLFRGRVKALQSDIGEERRLRQGVERNLADVLRGVREFQSQHAATITAENRETLDRVLRTVPGFDRSDTNGNGSR